ncbi:MAG: hypothetical protein ACRCUM_01735 [Mycoplasmoidaceae bacterium]
MGRFNSNIGKESAKSLLGSYGEDHAVSLGQPIRIYKFRKCSGILRLTPQGEQRLITDPASFSQVVNIYTSKEPVTIVWEGSTFVTVNEDDQLVKEFKVGKYYDLYNNSSFEVENKSENITFLNNEYTIQVLDKSVELISYDWIPEDVDITDYVYIILDKRSQSHQLLEISRVSPNWNEELERIENVVISFTNIGLKYAESGKNILDFFQFGAIGEGYAYPKEETIEEEGVATLVTSINSEYTRDFGVTSIQFDYMCAAADSSYAITGREIGYTDDNGNRVLDKPYKLFLHRELFPVSSGIFFNKPNTNSFIYENAIPSVQAIYASYKNAPSVNAALGGYNTLEPKEVLCGFIMLQSDVLASNKADNITPPSDWDGSTELGTNTYVRENWNNDSFFKMKQPYNFTGVNGIKSVTANSNGWANYNYTMFLNFNSYVNFSSDVFNFDFQETKKWKLTDVLGVVGGLVDILIGGLEIGWTTTFQQAPQQPINIRFPCFSYLSAVSAVDSSGPVPAETFVDETGKKMLPIGTNVLTSHRFSLTNLIKDTSQVRDGAPAGRGGGGIWNTKYIGQKHFEDGTLIWPDGSKFEWNPPTTTTVEPLIGTKFIVDAITTHIVSIADAKIVAFNEIGGKDIPVYQSLFRTVSKAVGDLRLWGTTMKFNYYEEFNTSGDRVKWPELVLPPPPGLDTSPVICSNDFDEETFSFDKEIVAFPIRPDEKIERREGKIFGVEYKLKATFSLITYTGSNYFLNNSPIIKGTSTKRQFNSLTEVEYVSIDIQFRCNDTIRSYEIYAYVDQNGDEIEQTFDFRKLDIKVRIKEDKRLIVRCRKQNPEAHKIVDFAGPYVLEMTHNVGGVESAFKNSIVTLKRIPINKTIEVSLKMGEWKSLSQSVVQNPFGTMLSNVTILSKNLNYSMKINSIVLFPKKIN